MVFLTFRLSFVEITNIAQTFERENFEHLFLTLFALVSHLTLSLTVNAKIPPISPCEVRATRHQPKDLILGHKVWVLR